ncbi:hypothetical protein [Parafrankia soli]|nr:hypothetical protein [Parafrankia soli]
MTSDTIARLDSDSDGRERMPDPYAVAPRAVEIFDAVRDHAEYDRLRASALRHVARWVTFTGLPLIAGWDAEVDGPDLVVEGVKVLAMRAAVYEQIGDERLAGLEVPAPVEEIVHALAARFTVLSRVQQDLDVVFVDGTGREPAGHDEGYDEDGYTDQVYAAATWGAIPRRYWIGQEETRRRLSVLFEHYESIGIQEGGQSHFFTFSASR